MKSLISLFCLALIAVGCTGTSPDLPPLNAVPSVELDRYLGKWYEISSYPAWFAEDCTATTAEYTLLSDGKIQVLNRCRKGSLDGPPDESKGTAEIADTGTNAKLKVTFFWPFKGGATIGSSTWTRTTDGRWWASHPANISGFLAARRLWTKGLTRTLFRACPRRDTIRAS